MVTKNELVAIIAALNTDFDAPATSSPERAEDNEARNDAYFEQADCYREQIGKRAS